MNCVRTAWDMGPNYPVMTPQPHFVPGYTGYVPQEMYRPGHTYGLTSHRILLDPCIAMSPRSVLNNIRPEDCIDEFGAQGLGSNSLGRQQLQPNKDPVYSGFAAAPNYKTILGHSQSPSCNRTMPNFLQERSSLFTKELQALDGWKFCYKRKPWDTTPNIRTTPGLGAFRDSPGVSPSMGCGCAGGRDLAADRMPRNSVNIGCGDNSTSLPLMTPGYSGCDYAQRRMWGCAQEAMTDCTVGRIVQKPNAFKFSHPPSRVQELYRYCEGMVPNYQGHVPGEVFRIGQTFGNASRNPKRHMQGVVKKPLCFPLKP